jgi:hypothetical protein
MKFCSHCGAQLQGDERFCVACGTPVTASPGSVPASGAVSVIAAPPIHLPPAAAAPMAPPPMVVPLPPPIRVPGVYAVPGSIPIGAGAPAAADNHAGKVWVGIILVAIVAGSYYYSKHKPAAAVAPAVPARPGAPAQPGTPGQPGTPAQPVDNGVLVQQQAFAGHWKAIYGDVEVTNASWTNHSTVAIQSATLQCDQYAANGADLSQIQTTLNGPVQPGGTTIFNPFQMGRVSVYMSRVNCAIVAVTPAS